MPTIGGIFTLSDLIYEIKLKRRDRIFPDKNGEGSFRLMKTILQDMAVKNVVDRSSTIFKHIINLKPGPLGRSYYIPRDNARFY